MSKKQDIRPGSDDDYDFLTEAPEIIRGNFPRMRAMKRRLIIEAIAISAFAVLCGWLHYSLTIKTGWILIVAASFCGLFLTADAITFYSYWYTSPDSDRGAAFRKVANRMDLTVVPMKIIRAIMALFIIGLILFDTFKAPVLTWQVLVLLVVSLAGLSIFSARWIVLSRTARRLAAQFRESKSKE